MRLEVRVDENVEVGQCEAVGHEGPRRLVRQHGVGAASRSEPHMLSSFGIRLPRFDVDYSHPTLATAASQLTES
jgi:hypothetical protein